MQARLAAPPRLVAYWYVASAAEACTPGQLTGRSSVAAGQSLWLTLPMSITSLAPVSQVHGTWPCGPPSPPDAQTRGTIAARTRPHRNDTPTSVLLDT